LKSEETKEEEGKKRRKTGKSEPFVWLFVSLSLSGVALEVFRRLSEDSKGKMKCLECKKTKERLLV